ncbi:hypothetical protein ACP0HM_27035 [Escherichia coli]
MTLKLNSIKPEKSRVDLLARVKLSHDKLKDLRERKSQSGSPCAGSVKQER